MTDEGGTTVDDAIDDAEAEGVPERSRDRIQSIERGVEVLRAFGGRSASLSAGEIVARVGLPRPVVRRILLTFEHLGYVRSHGGSWTLTPRILELGAGYYAGTSLPEIAHPVMDEVVAASGETCSIGVLDGREVIHVARVEERKPLPDAVRIGTRLPAHATALGKVLLAALPDDEFEQLLAGVDLERYTPHTPASPDELRDRIAVVRERGYDVSVEELHPGMVAAAVAIVVDGVEVGGIAVSSTTMRTSEQALTDDVVPVLREAAARIAQAYRNANPQLYRNALPSA